MTEYIDKQELLRDLERKIKEDNERRMAVVDRDFIDLVNDATVVEDVVEVVRCKNCKNYNTDNCSDGFGWCESSNSGTHDDRYCSEGERKTDDHRTEN